MDKRKFKLKGSKLLILGFTFKPNCPDIRNTKVRDLYDLLSEYGFDITVVDPWIDLEKSESFSELNIFNEFPQNKKFHSIITAVDHYQFSSLTANYLNRYLEKDHILFDLKDIIPRDLNPIRL